MLTIHPPIVRFTSPVAERAGDEVLSLPLSPAHSDEDVRDAIDAFQRLHDRLTA